MTEKFNSSIARLYQYEKAIASLTEQIERHRKEKARYAGDGTLCRQHRKKIYEWRRISFALHRKRSELKNRKGLLDDRIGRRQSASAA